MKEPLREPLTVPEHLGGPSGRVRQGIGKIATLRAFSRVYSPDRLKEIVAMGLGCLVDIVEIGSPWALEYKPSRRALGRGRGPPMAPLNLIWSVLLVDLLGFLLILLVNLLMI